jgi:hypothetical protein
LKWENVVRFVDTYIGKIVDQYQQNKESENSDGQHWYWSTILPIYVSTKRTTFSHFKSLNI